MTGAATAIPIFTSSLTSAAAKAVILISTVGQLFCGIACLTSASRMTFAFSRDGAVPGHNLWRRLSANKTPTWSVFFVVMFALIVTIPAYFPDQAGYPVAFFAVTTLSTVALYVAYTIPVFLRWRMGDKFQPGSWTLGAKYKWVNLIAIAWVVLYAIIGCLPFTPAAVPWNSELHLVSCELRADRPDRRHRRSRDLVVGVRAGTPSRARSARSTSERPAEAAARRRRGWRREPAEPLRPR